MKRPEASALIESLFESWGPSLFRYAYGASGSRAMADDLVQEAFMALYRELLSGKKIGNPRAWTLTVVRYQNSSHERSQRRHREHLQPSEALDTMPGADLAVEPAEPEFEDLKPFFSLLSKREREVLCLRIEALKYREIGLHLGISPKSVATILMRALGKLQTAVIAASTGESTSSLRDHNVSKTLQ
ncbi:MAG: sigma-70 family RNA polymerase sigma factor [Acidobacteria bacterium]|nr:sigma-70 family RNA polymerase sigma factor [Acidobacteriota bacterium]MCI0621818.1 sigma-70 family RNA polymerase sigma factor [Acidobacteriota bacterium]MCI0720871.1 sigma-70 family RNA polymerase sigma factor [Acidobacteriota bacterium]